MTGQFTQHGLYGLEGAKWFATLYTTIGLRLVQDLRLLALGRAQEAWHQLNGVFWAGGGTQATLHTVLFNEPQLRQIGVVLQCAGWTCTDTAQAQSAFVGIDFQST